MAATQSIEVHLAENCDLAKSGRQVPDSSVLRKGHVLACGSLPFAPSFAQSHFAECPSRASRFQMKALGSVRAPLLDMRRVLQRNLRCNGGEVRSSIH